MAFTLAKWIIGVDWDWDGKLIVVGNSSCFIETNGSSKIWMKSNDCWSYKWKFLLIFVLLLWNRLNSPFNSDWICRRATLHPYRWINTWLSSETKTLFTDFWKIMKIYPVNSCLNFPVLWFDFDDRNIHPDFLDRIDRELVYTEFFSFSFLNQYLHLGIAQSATNN